MFLRDAFNIILGNDCISIFHDQHSVICNAITSGKKLTMK